MIRYGESKLPNSMQRTALRAAADRQGVIQTGRRTMKCHNCTNNAMFAVGEGDGVPLCLNCWIRFQNAHHAQMEQNFRMMNFLNAEFETVGGTPGMLPRFAPPRLVTHVGGVTLNHFNISGSQIGVLNTGTIENLDATVTLLNNSGNDELASAIVVLVEAILANPELPEPSKKESVELLGEIAQQSAAPEGARKLSVARAMVHRVEEVLKGVGAIADLWATVKAIVGPMFGI